MRASGDGERDKLVQLCSRNASFQMAVSGQGPPCHESESVGVKNLEKCGVCFADS